MVFEWWEKICNGKWLHLFIKYTLDKIDGELNVIYAFMMA